MILKTERLVLRPIKIDDAKNIFEYRSDKEINKYQGWIPETIEDVKTFIGKCSTKINEPDTWFQLVIIEKENRKIIGDLGIHFIAGDNQQAEIGCTLNKDYQNKGYATESLKRVIDMLFTDLNKHRIFASLDPGNKSSIRLVERIGFRKEAHFVESILIKGKWADDLIYAMIEKDWEKINTRS